MNADSCRVGCKTTKPVLCFWGLPEGFDGNALVHRRLDSEPDLMAYLRAQEQIVSELIKSVRDLLPKHVRLNLIPTVQRPQQVAGWRELD